MKIRPNYIYALISMTLVLFLVGVFGSIISQSQQLIKSLKEKVILMVELEDGFPDTAIEDLRFKVLEQDYVKENSLQFVSKVEGARLMKEDLGSDVDLSDFHLVNPLNDIFTFHLKVDYVTIESLEKIANSIKKDERVSDVVYQEKIVGTFSGYWSKVGWIGLAFSLILVLVAIFLIIYAVRQALYADRFLIKNMHLVGASPKFINRPYLRKGIIGGIISALVAGTALLFLRYWLIKQIPSLAVTFTLFNFSLICLLIMALGIVITGSSTWFTVRHFLKSNVNELYD